MEPVLIPMTSLSGLQFAVGAEEGGLDRGTDYSKYDGRHLRDRLSALQRLMVASLVALGLVLLFGDTILISDSARRSNLVTSARSVRVREHLGGAHAHDPALRVVEDGDEPPVLEAVAEAVGGGLKNRLATVEGLEAAFADAGGADGPLQPVARPAPVTADSAAAAAAAPAGGGEAAGGVTGGSGSGAGTTSTRSTPSGGTPWWAAKPSGADEDYLELKWSLLEPGSTPGGICDAYFGNGYSEVLNLLPAPDPRAPQLLTCHKHPATEAVYCDAAQVIMHPDRMTMSAGGEDLETVLGRNEEAELPVFHQAAFETYVEDPTLPPGTSSSSRTGAGLDPLILAERGFAAHLAARDAYKGRMLEAWRVVGGSSPWGHVTGAAGKTGSEASVCSVYIEEPVIAVTRMEYANLFHTSTDWWNVWQTARIAGLAPTSAYPPAALTGLTPASAAAEAAAPRAPTRRLPAHVLFLDGHNASPMDDGWRGAFLSINYAKHFEGPVCFRRLLFAPFGYHAAISSGLVPMRDQCRQTPFLTQFRHDFVRGFGLPLASAAACGAGGAPGAAPAAGADVHPDDAGSGGSSLPVLFVRRVHYKAHPRHDGRIVRRLDNEDDIYDALLTATTAGQQRGGAPSLSLMNGLFSSMTVKEQVAAAQSACVIVGAHGAGLSHILFAPPGVHMLELQPPMFQRPHFVSYTYWAGGWHHNWVLESSTPDPGRVVDMVYKVAAQAREGEAGDAVILPAARG